MLRLLAFLYGLVAYVFFLGVFLYAMGFVGNMVVPKGIDTGEVGPLSSAMFVNLLLLGVFGLQHTIMARPSFKAWWCKIVPPVIERSTYVVLTNVILTVMFWQWQPMSKIVWWVERPALHWGLIGLSFAGWLLALYSTFVIDHFGLFGMRQVYLNLMGRQFTNPPFQERTVYRLIRHPLMLGFIVAFWATPRMTQGHLLFAAATTAYILVALQFEERTLLSMIGQPYREYRARTPMLIPLPKRAPVSTTSATSE